MSDATREGTKKPTLADVAKVAGVDTSVVSRVLRNDPQLSVRPSTRDQVLAAAQELGYRPNAAAQTLRTARARAFGLLIPDFTNPIYAEIIQGAEAAAAERDCVLLTGSARNGLTPDELYTGMLAEGRVDALLVAGIHQEQTTTQREAASHGLPVLLVNRRAAGAHRYVILDDEHAAELAVRHLLELGHSRIGHVAGPDFADTAERRMRGYRRALQAAGIDYDEDLVVRADYTHGGGATAMAQLMNSPKLPTAVFVANVASAIGVLFAAQEGGVAIPDDLSVVAVHDLPLAEYLVPPLTTVRMPLNELGRRALEAVADQRPRDPIEQVITAPIELVVRRSTAPPRRFGPHA